MGERSSVKGYIISLIFLFGLLITMSGLIMPKQVLAFSNSSLVKAYITNFADNSVSVLDVATKTVTATVYGFNGPWGVAVKQDGTRVYISNYNGGTVSVINTETDSKITDISIGGLYPKGMAISPDGLKLYVISQNYLKIINTSTNTVASTVNLGISPSAITASPDGLKLYLTSGTGNNVSVFETASNNITAIINVGMQPSAITISPDGSRVYVANYGDSTLSVIDTATNNVIGSPAVDIQPNGITVSPNGALVYVTDAYFGNVSVIETTNNTVTSNIPVGQSPSGIGFSPDGLWVLAVNSSSGSVSVINAANNTVVDTITVGNDPRSLGNFIASVPADKFEFSTPVYTVNEKGGTATITVKRLNSSGGNASIGYTICDGTAINDVDYLANTTGQLDFGPGETSKTINISIFTDEIAEGLETVNLSLVEPIGGTLGNRSTAKLNIVEKIFAYVGNYYSKSVSVIDTDNNQVVENIPVQYNPYGIAVNSSGTKAYVSNYGSDTVSVINTAGRSVTTTVDVGGGPKKIIISPDDSLVYVSNAIDKSISVINTTTDTIAGAVYFTSTPNGITLSPDGSKLYITFTSAGKVSVVDTANLTVTNTINVIDGPDGIAMNPEGTKVYVTNSYADYISVVDSALSNVIDTVYAGLMPLAIAINSEGTRAYVSNRSHDSVAIIDLAANISHSIPVGDGPTGVAISPDGSKTYVANRYSNSVSIIDNGSENVISTIGVGLEPVSVGNFVSVFSQPIANQIQFKYASYAVSEKGGFAKITVIRTGDVSGTATVDYAATDVSALAGADYLPTNGTLTFEPGETIKTINIPLMTDIDKEPSETLLLTLSNPTGGPVLGNRSTATITISDSPFTYIGNYGENTVSVINTDDYNLSGIVEVGMSPGSIAVSQDAERSRVYVVNHSSGTISVLNGWDNTVITTVYAGKEPRGIAVSPDGKQVFVANSGDNTVSVLETTDYLNYNLTHTVAVGLEPYAIAVTPDGNQVYVTNRGENTVAVFDTVDYVASGIIVGNNPWGIAISPDGSKAYVTNETDNSVTVIYTGFNIEIITVANVGLSPRGIVVRPDGKKIYVTNHDADTVSIIDTMDYTVSTPFNVGHHPDGIAINSNGNLLFVPNSASDTVTVLDTINNAIVTNVYAGPYPKSFGNFIGTESTTLPFWPENSVLSVTNKVNGSLTLNWEPAYDYYGVTAYRIFMNDFLLDEFPTQAAVDGLYSYSVSDLSPDMYYDFRVDAGNAAGNWSMGPSVTVSTFATPDTIPLAVYSKNPADTTTGVAINSPINIVFNQDILVGPDFSLISLKAGSTVVDYNYCISGGTLTLTPSGNLAYNTTYTVTVPVGSVVYGVDNTLAYDETFSFTTMAEPDTVGPIVNSTVPVSSANGVALGSSIQIMFNENIFEGQNIFDLSLKMGNTVVGFNYSISASTLTLTPSGSLAYETTYTVTVPAGVVKDAAGNTLALSTTFNFTTMVEPDTVGPAVYSTSPGNYAKSTAVGSPIQIIFNENIQAGENIESISLQAGSTIVNYAYSISGKTLTLTVSGGLDNYKTYTVNIPVNAVKDITGNHLADNYTFYFKTEMIPDKNLAAAIRSALDITGEINGEDMAALTHFEAGGLSIAELTGLEYATNLQELDLAENNITSLTPLAGLTNLRALYLGNNWIQDVHSLVDLTNLEELWLYNNNLSEVSGLSELTNLTVLGLQNNQITSVSGLEDLTKIQRLYLSNNQISNLEPLANLLELNGLYLGGNQISELAPLAGLTGLRELWLNNNQINDISSISALVNLKYLDLQSQYPGLTDIMPLDKLTKLKEINLNYNSVNDLTPLTNLTNLQGLYLRSNQITDLSPLVTNSQRGGIGKDNCLDIRYNYWNEVSVNLGESLETLINSGIKVIDYQGGI